MNINRFLILLCFAIGSTYVLQAQVSSYNFNETTEDQVGGHHATVFGNPSFVNGEYISFTPGEYLSLPLAMSEAIDVSGSWQIQVRFKVEGDWRATEDEEAQLIVSSKVYDQRVGGFDITAREWSGKLQLITTYGDGITYEPYDCPTCGGHVGLSEGKLDWVIDIEPGIWYDVKVKFYFDGDRPYIQYEVNGTVSISYFDDRVDAEGFRQTINQQQIWVGADQENRHNIFHAETPRMDLQIDYLSFWSPIPPGNPDKVGEALQALIDHMKLPQESADDGTGKSNDEDRLTDEQTDSLRVEFVKHWDSDSYEPNKAVVWDYINTYATHNEPIFNDWIVPERPENFVPMEAIQFIISQWILDNRYGPETVSDMEGLVFEDHELFPGRVSSLAPRLEGATFVINGDYQTNLGFTLNDQDEVIRMTGYYVPPGELVTLTVPDEAVNKGLSLYVGAHNANLQHTRSQFRRFPRIMTIYEMDAKTITVANPFGGGLYIKVPDGSQLGPLEFNIEGAIKAPYYSTVEGYSRSLEEFKADLVNQYVPWVDIESHNMKATIMHGMASVVNDFDLAISIWNNSFDAVNTTLGRPLGRFRAEYFMIDRQNHFAGTAIPASYPMAFERLDEPYSAKSEMPMMVERGRDWYRGKNENFHNIILHEQGHLHNMPTLFDEQETNVHILAAAAYSIAMGESVDSAMVYSNQQKVNLDESALDWMLVDNFYLGNRIGYRVESQERSWDEQAYQSRGHAKYVDIAHMFGWEALGKTMSPFYVRQTEDPLWSPYSLEDDEYIETASNELGFNMAPHFEFWGIIPSDALVERLKDMPTSDLIKDRLIHFRSLIPANNEEFQELYGVMISKLEPHHHVRYDEWKTTYDEARAQRVIDRIDEILNKYYDINALDYNFNPVITGTSDTLYAYQNSSLSLELSHFLVKDADNDYPDDFTLSVAQGSNYSVSGNILTPDTDFLGELKVSVTVSDGQEDSDPFEATIQVVVENVRPTISGVTSSITMTEDISRTLELDDFTVNDSDHNYPNGFTLKLSEGEHYSISGNTITPELDFFGIIEVPVTVSDGIQNSKVFIAEINVSAVNDAPRIQGPARLMQIDEDASKHFRTNEFIIEDPDDEPGAYGIEILEGENYTVENNIVTPQKDFHGRLSVAMVANDFKDVGDTYQLLVEVLPVNDAPIINGIVSSLWTKVNHPITLELTDFVVFDPDNDFPNDFTLTILEGDNYSVSNTTVTPDPSFTGELGISMIVNDGESDSDPAYATIEVVLSNDQPIVTGMVSSISIDEDTPFSISLNDLIVEDDDHTYPDDFSIRYYDGADYTRPGDGSLIPEKNFFGELNVKVSVHDGIEESEIFEVKVTVNAVNDQPNITSYSGSFDVNEDESFSLNPDLFEVQDPDNSFPDDFTLSIADGSNHTADGMTVTPSQNFNGILSLLVTVNDGTESSDPLTLIVDVKPVNDAPEIKGLVEPLTTEVDMSIELVLDHFTIEDPDNDFPQDFALMVLEGENYTLSGSTVIPVAGFIGTLSVPVMVSDGLLDSEEFFTSVEVAEVLSIENAYVKRNFSINPNPTSDWVTITKNPSVSNYSIILYNLKGEAVYTDEAITNDIKSIDLRSLSNGFYILKIKSVEGVGTFKIIKR